MGRAKEQPLDRFYREYFSEDAHTFGYSIRSVKGEDGQLKIVERWRLDQSLVLPRAIYVSEETLQCFVGTLKAYLKRREKEKKGLTPLNHAEQLYDQLTKSVKYTGEKGRIIYFKEKTVEDKSKVPAMVKVIGRELKWSKKIVRIIPHLVNGHSNVTGYGNTVPGDNVITGVNAGTLESRVGDENVLGKEFDEDIGFEDSRKMCRVPSRK